MTPKNLFTVILKILGIWLVKDFLLTIPQLFSIVFASAAMGEKESFSIYFVMLIIFYLVLIYFLLFETAKIIKLFQLDKDFANESFNLNVNKFSILEIALIVIGGILLIDEVPALISNIISYLNQKQFIHDMQVPASSQLIINVVKLLTGYLLIAKHKQIAAYFGKDKSNADPTS